MSGCVGVYTGTPASVLKDPDGICNCSGVSSGGGGSSAAGCAWEEASQMHRASPATPRLKKQDHLPPRPLDRHKWKGQRPCEFRVTIAAPSSTGGGFVGPHNVRACMNPKITDVGVVSGLPVRQL